MKTIAILFVVACMSLCYVSAVQRQLWGHKTGHILGKEVIVTDKATSQYQVRAFAFPNVSNKKDPIMAIEHFDYAVRPSTMEIVYGGVPRKEVAILLKSARGHAINSTIIFYKM